MKPSDLHLVASTSLERCKLLRFCKSRPYLICHHTQPLAYFAAILQAHGHNKQAAALALLHVDSRLPAFLLAAG